MPGTLPRGMGDAAQVVAMGSSAATPVVTGLLASNAAAAAAASGTAASILGMSVAVAIPVIGAAIAGVTLLAVHLLRSGCGKTCVVTSQWANQAEDVLSQNIKAYFALPAPRSRSQQNAALNNFDVIWAKLGELCGQAGLGPAGVNCIADRRAGACKWKQTADSPLLAYPGQPQPGSCWNWFNGYRDPIANDTQVVEDSVLQAQALGGSISQTLEQVNSFGGGLLVPVLGLGLIVWGVSQA